MRKEKSDRSSLSSLALAVAAPLVAVDSEATTYVATLKSVTGYAGFGSSSGNITSSTATWSFDDVTGLLSQTGGTFNVRFTINPSTTTLCRHSITGLVIGSGSAASATTFSCTEGNFGTAVGASLCGNYTFGATNESTVTWGPGTASARTLGGDDTLRPAGADPNNPPGNHIYWLGSVSGQQHSVAYYNGVSTVSWVGTTLVLSNRSCDSTIYGSGGSNCPAIGGYNQGYQFVLDVSPSPLP
jgi:hypothetical protein